MKTEGEETSEFTSIATGNARIVWDQAKALRDTGVDGDELVIAAAMLTVAYAHLTGLDLGRLQKIIADHWDEGHRQLAARGHLSPKGNA